MSLGHDTTTTTAPSLNALDFPGVSPKDASPAKFGPASQDESSSQTVTSAESHAPALRAALTDVKGQIQFLLYLADQIEESLGQIDAEADPGQAVFIAKILNMYANQLESKHRVVGESVSRTCRQVHAVVRGRDSV